MLGKLTDWIVGREPVATATGLAGGVVAVAGALTAFDVVAFTPEQIAALAALAAWAAGYLARRLVTPVAGERGSIGLFILLGVAAVVVFGFALDACFDDRSETNDVGMSTEDNRPCEGDNACQGRQKKGCAEASAPCSDDDKVTVIICPQPDSCRFEGET